MKLLAAIAAACFCASAFGQGVRFDKRVATIASNYPPGSQVPVMAIPNSTVTICTDGNCVSPANIFSNQGLTVHASNPMKSDFQGNFGFWASPGNYFYKVVLPTGTFVGIFPITLGGSTSGGAVSSVNGQTGTVVLTASNVGADPSGAAATAQAAAIASAASTALQLAGGTMTGPIVLPGDPTTNLQASTKQYVDAHGVTTFNTRAGAVTLAASDVNGVGTISNPTTGNSSTATNINTNGTANQIWGMNSGATAQGWQTLTPGTTTLQTNGANISTQTALNLINSTVNGVGLTATFSNPTGSSVKVEVGGSSYGGNSATATSATTAANLSGTPTLPNGTSATTQSPGDNTTKIATDAFVLANASALPDCTDTSGVSFICTVPVSAPSFSATGTTPGAMKLQAGTGSIPTLPTNSAGFAAPVTGGTAWLGKLPATITAGILHFAAPATADGVNESVITSSAVSLTADVTGVLPAANIAAALSSTTSVNGTTIPSSVTLTQTIASGTSALGTSAIASGACATVVTTTATGVASTDAISWNANGSLKAITGYIPSTSGGLTIADYPTSGNVNFDVCNWTSASITPGAVTLNWRVVR